MIQFFEFLANVFKAIFHGIGFVFGYIPKLLTAIGVALGDVGVIFGMLPTYVLAFGIVTLIAAVIFLILRIFHG